MNKKIDASRLKSHHDLPREIDDMFFVFSSLPVPGSSVLPQFDPGNPDKSLAHLTRHEAEKVDFTGIPMHFEHESLGFNNERLASMGYVTSSKKMSDGGISVMIEIPPVPVEVRSGVENDLRRKAIYLVMTGAFRDVSEMHKVDFHEHPDGLLFSKKIHEISLTKEGRHEGSSITDYDFSPVSTRVEKEKPVQTFQTLLMHDRPKETKKSIQISDETEKQNLNLAEMSNPANTIPPKESSVDAHLSAQLEQQQRQLLASKMEQEKMMKELEHYRNKAMQLEAVESRKRTQEVMDVVNTAKRQAIEIVEELGLKDDPEVAERLKGINLEKYGTSTPANANTASASNPGTVDGSAPKTDEAQQPPQEPQMKMFDFSDPETVKVGTEDFINTIKTLGTLVFANSRALAAKKAMMQMAQKQAASSQPLLTTQTSANIPTTAAALPSYSSSSFSTTSSSSSSASASAPTSLASSSNVAQGVPPMTTAPVGSGRQIKYDANPGLFANLGTKPPSSSLFFPSN